MPKTHDMPRVAYFCMEYGLHEEFAIYSGGLGILAGDHLKASADQNLRWWGSGCSGGRDIPLN